MKYEYIECIKDCHWEDGLSDQPFIKKGEVYKIDEVRNDHVYFTRKDGGTHRWWLFDDEFDTYLKFKKLEKYKVYRGFYNHEYPVEIFNNVQEGYFEGDSFICKNYEKYFINKCGVTPIRKIKRKHDNWKRSVSKRKFERGLDECIELQRNGSPVWYNHEGSVVYRIEKDANGKDVYIKYSLSKLPEEMKYLREEYHSLYFEEKPTGLAEAMRNLGKTSEDNRFDKQKFCDAIDKVKKLENLETNTSVEDDDEYTGGSVNYYKLRISTPTTLTTPYDVECNDIIEALDMNYAEGNAFKGIWRKCAARKLGIKKKGYDNGLYDSEKVVFFGERMVMQSKTEVGDVD